jgi:hypothetical protein
MSQPLPFVFNFAAAPARIFFKLPLILIRPLATPECIVLWPQTGSG